MSSGDPIEFRSPEGWVTCVWTREKYGDEIIDYLSGTLNGEDIERDEVLRQTALAGRRLVEPRLRTRV